MINELKEEETGTGATLDRQDSMLLKNSYIDEAPIEKVFVDGTTQESCRLLTEELNTTNQDINDLEKELELVHLFQDIQFDDQHPGEFHLRLLDEKINASTSSISELESQWSSYLEEFEKRKRNLKDSLYGDSLMAQEKLAKLRLAEQEHELLLSEILRRDEEIFSLTSELEKQPKLPSRISYIERVKNITKNSRKQDADILQILKDTRELQMERNSIQERLHRTYAVVEENIFREANISQVGREAYKLLTTIHDNFEQITETILETDRVRREFSELEEPKPSLIHYAEKVRSKMGSQISPPDD